MIKINRYCKIQWNNVEFEVDYDLSTDNLVEDEYIGVGNEVLAINQFTHKETCFLQFLDEDFNTVCNLILEEI